MLSNAQRTKILLFLLDNRFHTVNEITQKTDLKNNTVSFHLGKFLKAAWVICTVKGKFHYYRLKNAQVAALIETMLVLAPRKEILSFTQNKVYLRLKQARVCYDHLAGELGVNLLQQLLQKKWITNTASGLVITSHGSLQLAQKFNISFAAFELQDTMILATCPDWSENKRHLKGALGRQLLRFMFVHAWLYFPVEDSRAVALTAKGRRKFKEYFD
ncbi:ArsR/SmtB family transcription factor [Liquorilactobacillus satsumensis]|uniref:Transcriptional regulator, ArsR family n=1 Tax=Liquorilactobacillus satsumensis DSM 16230 = JCM 12392 TaxID=1423801 RepID=A0A0R1UZM1_9LACO|nr:helix-turn-helix transcriptional regulator [Liquorilactobacillus satsumensis]KRL98861.1 transcriptional regulator, ArsR family [Liquorilactobacillus satsumensis DSM 16230 = JCM 12392]MCP9327956.1 helix-turn-helix transcriptional regulator [Liquorilactobacillus satsumensis]